MKELIHSSEFERHVSLLGPHPDCHRYADDVVDALTRSCISTEKEPSEQRQVTPFRLLAVKSKFAAKTAFSTW